MRQTLIGVCVLFLLKQCAFGGMIYPSGGRMAFEKIESSEFSPSESATDFDSNFTQNIFRTIVRPRPRAISVVSANLYQFEEDSFGGYTTTAATAHGGPDIFAKATADLMIQFAVSEESLLELCGRFVVFYNNETSMVLKENGNVIYTLPYGPGNSEDYYRFLFLASENSLYELSIYSFSSDTDSQINSFGSYIELNVSSVPEPSAWILFLVGLTILLFVARRLR